MSDNSLDTIVKEELKKAATKDMTKEEVEAFEAKIEVIKKLGNLY